MTSTTTVSKYDLGDSEFLFVIFSLSAHNIQRRKLHNVLLLERGRWDVATLQPIQPCMLFRSNSSLIYK